jgi:hypothetical protein
MANMTLLIFKFHCTTTCDSRPPLLSSITAVRNVPLPDVVDTVMKFDLHLRSHTYGGETWKLNCLNSWKFTGTYTLIPHTTKERCGKVVVTRARVTWSLEEG